VGVVGGVQRLLCGGAFVLIGLWAAIIILKFDLVFFLIDFMLFVFFISLEQNILYQYTTAQHNPIHS